MDRKAAHSAIKECGQLSSVFRESSHSFALPYPAVSCLFGLLSVCGENVILNTRHKWGPGSPHSLNNHTPAPLSAPQPCLTQQQSHHQFVQPSAGGPVQEQQRLDDMAFSRSRKIFISLTYICSSPRVVSVKTQICRPREKGRSPLPSQRRPSRAARSAEMKSKHPRQAPENGHSVEDARVLGRVSSSRCAAGRPGR